MEDTISIQSPKIASNYCSFGVAKPKMACWISYWLRLVYSYHLYISKLVGHKSIKLLLPKQFIYRGSNLQFAITSTLWAKKICATKRQHIFSLVVRRATDATPSFDQEMRRLGNIRFYYCHSPLPWTWNCNQKSPKVTGTAKIFMSDKRLIWHFGTIGSFALCLVQALCYQAMCL